MSAAGIAIEPRGPFSWEAAGQVGEGFGPVAHNWQGEAVRMTFLLDGSFEPVAVDLRFEAGRLRGEVAGTRDLEAAANQVARVFSLDADGTEYPKVGDRDPAVGRLMRALPGLRPVCFTSPYECAAWGVTSQRVSMRQARAVKARMIAEHGHRLRVGGVEVGCFPDPERLLRIESVPGLSAEKVDRLHGVARAALDGLLDCARLRALGDVAGPESLRAIPGIGPFWSSGIYLRGCGIQDVFPDEPIAIAALAHLHGSGDTLSGARLEALTEPYRPFRMWVCFLLRVAVNRGLIEGVAGREMRLRREHRPARSPSAPGADPRRRLGCEGGDGGPLERRGARATAGPVDIASPAHGPARAGALQQPHRVAGRDQPLLQHPQVPAVAAVRLDPGEQVGAPPPVGDLVAGPARLADLDRGLPHPVDVPDADRELVLAADREVLAEAAGADLLDVQLRAPERVVLGRVGEHRHVRPAVAAPVGLPVSIQVQAPEQAPAGHRLLVEGRPPASLERAGEPDLGVVEARLPDLDRHQAGGHASGAITSTSLPIGSFT